MRDLCKKLLERFKPCLGAIRSNCAAHPARLAVFWLVMLAGLFARVYMFGDVPGDINQDEAFAGYNAFTLMQHARDSFGYRMPVYLTAWGSGMNALESYLMIPFIAIFGLKVWAIRLPMLIVGILSLVAIYKIVLRFSGEKFALIAMFLVAISPWHIMLSRWALESNLAPGFVLFGLFFFIKGLDNPKFLPVSALCYGLSLYAYATIWAVVPFIVVAGTLYAIWTRSLRATRYAWIALAVLVALACPLVLFLLVNKGIIAEIKLPFLSIPKMVFFRDSEISFAQIPENAANLWNILKSQSDGLPWNSIRRHGIFYDGTLAFFFVGLGVFIWKAVQDFRQRKAGIAVFMLVWLLAGLAIGLLIHVNINRVNLLFLPMIVIAAYGFIYAFSFIHPKTICIAVAAYTLMFASFEREYFTSYRESIGEIFCEGIEDAMHFAQSKMGENTRMVVDPNTSYPRILFFGKVDLDAYLSTVSYTNFPSAFLYVNSFDRYIFKGNIPRGLDKAVYLFENNYDRTNALQDAGFQIRNFGKYVVGYRE